MKELSIEDKAKAYDRAIEELRGLLEGVHEEKCDIMEEDIIKIFPELKESEELTEFEKAVKQVMEEAIECGDTRNLKADADMLLSLIHKSAWSEEDESNLDSAIYFIRREPYHEHDAEPIVDWLKSLKNRVQPQSTWKPSDEQIKAVKEAACYSSVFSEKTIDNLISLSKDLKKLKG